MRLWFKMYDDYKWLKINIKLSNKPSMQTY